MACFVDNVALSLSREEAQEVVSALTRDLNQFHVGSMESRESGYAKTYMHLDTVRKKLVYLLNREFVDEKDGEVYE